MRARVLVGGLVAISTVVVAEPASAKASIVRADISGPGLDGVIRIEAPDTEGLWESGVDVVGGLDDTRAASVEELGLIPADLGPRYLATYRFGSDDRIRQDLYPYASGGPVTYTTPGQELTGLFGDAGDMPITAGWYRSSPGFFDLLVDHGLPERDPVAPLATAGLPQVRRQARSPWARIVMVLVVFSALSLATLAVRPGCSRPAERTAERARRLRGTSGGRRAPGSIPFVSAWRERGGFRE